MRTKLLIILLPLLAAGCKEKETACAEYAPADTAISWTDYNSVSDVVKYFRCHKKTSDLHHGDTLKIMGYVCKGYPNHWSPSYIVGNDYHLVTLTDNASQLEYDDAHMINLTLSDNLADLFMQNRDEYMEKEWYVAGRVHSVPSDIVPASHCCNYYTSLAVLEVELKLKTVGVCPTRSQT